MKNERYDNIMYLYTYSTPGARRPLHCQTVYMSQTRGACGETKPKL